MNKASLIVRLALAVSSAGLVSCAKDEKTRDVYQAPPPVINQKGAQDLKAWDRRSDKSLDLQDSFDVSKGNPAKLQVTSRCRRDQQSYLENFTFLPRGPIKVFQVLPPDLLTRDIVSEKIDCAFELVLSNEVGSKHIYQINTTPVTDLTGAGASIEKTGSDEKITQIHAKKMDGLRVRYRNAGPAAAQVFCQDMTLPDLPFEQVADMIHFNFAAPELKQGRHGETLTENPLQACRILIRQGGQLQQISPRFLVQLPQSPMVVVVDAIAPSLVQKQSLWAGGVLNAARVSVKNPDRVGKRFLRIDKLGREAVIQGLNSHEAGGRPSAARIDQYVRPWSFALPVNSPAVVVEDKGDHYRMSIPAGSSAFLVMQIRPAGRISCPLLTKEIAVAAKLELLEVSDRQEPLEKIHAVLPLSIYFETPGHKPAPTPGPCGW